MSRELTRAVPAGTATPHRARATRARVSALVALLLSFGCGGSNSSASDGNTAGGGSATAAAAANTSEPAVTFTQVYALLFPRSSAGQCEMCHALPAHDVVNGNLETGMTQQSAYDALVGKISQSTRCMSLPLVTPGDPEMSLFYLKLTAQPPCGVRMPNGGAGLTDDQVAMVRSWILGGAKND